MLNVSHSFKAALAIVALSAAAAGAFGWTSAKQAAAADRAPEQLLGLAPTGAGRSVDLGADDAVALERLAAAERVARKAHALKMLEARREMEQREGIAMLHVLRMMKAGRIGE